jgi:hypothetical protein
MTLVLRTGGEIRVMPDQFYRLHGGDQILHCGRDRDLDLLAAILHDG